MPQTLNDLEIREVSLVDAPANSSTDPLTGRKTPRARIALFKRDEPLTEDDIDKAVHGRTQGGVTYPRSDYAYTPSAEPSTWKLRLTKTPGGSPDPGIVGAAVAALGKGFRGNKVQIPDADLPAVRSRVRSAWKQANPDKGGEELSEVLKGETMPLTLEQIEKRQNEQDVILKRLTDENDVLKKERELVLKMSKKQRKAYASMSESMQKDFMAGDTEKRKQMCDTAMKEKKEKALEDSMDEACKAEFAKAGPSRRIQMLAEAERAVAKTAKEKGGKPQEDDEDDPDTDSDNNDDADTGGDDEDDKDQKLTLRKRMNTTITAMTTELANANDRIAKAEKILEDVRKAERLSYFTKRAEAELPNTAGSPVEKGTHLMTVADALGEGSEVFKAYMDNLTAADKAMTIHFGEVGKSGGTIPAEKALEAKAQEIAKRDRIDSSHAMAKAMEEAPELYIAYEQQHRKAIQVA